VGFVSVHVPGASWSCIFARSRCITGSPSSYTACSTLYYRSDGQPASAARCKRCLVAAVRRARLGGVSSSSRPRPETRQDPRRLSDPHQLQSSRQLTRVHAEESRSCQDDSETGLLSRSRVRKRAGRPRLAALRTDINWLCGFTLQGSHTARPPDAAPRPWHAR
jgi:hypothetical protein